MNGINQPTASMAVLIYNFSSVPYDNMVNMAWSASLVLIVLVLVTNIISPFRCEPRPLNIMSSTVKESTPPPCAHPYGRIGPDPPEYAGRAAQHRRPDFPPPPTRAARLNAPAVIEIDNVDFYYGKTKALHGVSLPIREKLVTAFIGPSGCGKSTLLRCLNRMNDLVEGTRVGAGSIRISGVDINDPSVDVIELRKRVGMVFQKSNPFPKSIYENVVYGLRLQGLNDKGEAGRDGRAQPARRGLVGRGAGPAAHQCAGTFRRPAAAAVHRARHRGRAGNHPHQGRARARRSIRSRTGSWRSRS